MALITQMISLLTITIVRSGTTNDFFINSFIVISLQHYLPKINFVLILSAIISNMKPFRFNFIRIQTNETSKRYEKERNETVGKVTENCEMTKNLYCEAPSKTTTHTLTLT